MAGLGRKVFAPGEVLTATNVQNYLMDQAVQVYPGTAARGSAIGSATTEGMVAYLADVNSVQMATGTATWVNVDSLPIVAGTATRDALYPSPVAGNTVFRSDTGVAESYYSAYSTAVPGGRDSAGWYATSRVDGLVPIVPSSVSVGSGSSSIGALGKVTLTTVGTSFSLNGVFSSAYENYKVVMQGVTASASALTLRFRAAGTDRTSGNYDWVGLVADATGPRQARNTGQTNITTSLNVATNHTSEMLFYTPNLSGVLTRVKGESLSWATGNVNSIAYHGLFNTAQVDDGFTISTGANFTGTIQVYGFN